MIDKKISMGWDVQTIFDEQSKIASYVPETHVPEEIASFIANLVSDPRFCYVHVIAMSDGASYGSNLNGDIFRADELTDTQSQREADKNPGEKAGIQVPRYKTFEQAKFYRHHANSPIDPHYGDVPVAAWNEPMRRVELIIRVFKESVPELGGHGAPDIVRKLDQRGHLTVSMGTRIHHEQCIYCKNENEFVHQRCDHLKNHMNEIMPDGRLVAADNFEPRFFDISDVNIPADPIAFSLQKVAALASAAQRPVNTAVNHDGPEFDWYRKLSEMDKQIMSQPTVGETPVDSPPCKTCPVLPGQHSFKAEELKAAFTTVNNLDTFVSTTALMGIVLSPHELAFVTNLAEPEKVSTNEFNGIRNLSLDNFSVPLYHSLLHKVAERSGYLALCPVSGWEPTKIASDGFNTMADYYSYYRQLLASIPSGSFMKAANKNRWVRELLGEDQYARVKSAMYHLAHAGIAV